VHERLGVAGAGASYRSRGVLQIIVIFKAPYHFSNESIPKIFRQYGKPDMRTNADLRLSSPPVLITIY
jgi:hypothetical protein